MIRRVYLDLTGLPPTPSEVDAFLADRSGDAYEKVVDRLLDSPRYGEHMARFWLDAARYGDTHGLHLDNYREIWPYRDWVIKAFQRQQAVRPVHRRAARRRPACRTRRLDQLIATGFNRCHVSTSEGGSIEEEVYVRNVVDQVDTNGTVFLGLTIGCARCHDHKYDPVRTKDYYQLFAFFNNIDGPALDGNAAQWAPIVKVPSPEQKAALDAGRQEDRRAASDDRRRGQPSRGRLRRQGRRRARASSSERADFVWIDDALPPGASPQGDGPWEFVARPDHPVHSGQTSLRISAKGLKQRFFDNAGRKLKVGEGDKLFAYVFLDPLEPSQGDHASVAHRRGLDASGLLGREPDRLGQGRHARAVADRRPAADRQVGAARGRGDEAGPQAGHADRRLGLHPARRHGLLGHGRDRDLDAAGGPALRLAHRLDSGPARQMAARGCRKTSRRFVKLDRAKRTEAQNAEAAAAYFVEHAYSEDRVPCSSRCTRSSPRPRRSASRSKSRSRRPWSSARRPASRSRRSSSTGANTTSAATRSAAPLPAFLPPLAARRAGESAGPGPVAGRARPPADGPGGRQPVLASGLRHGHRQDGRGLRLAGRAAEPSRAARLAGRPVPRGRLGREAVHEAAGDVGDLPAELARDAGDAWPRTRPTACSRAGRGSGSTPRRCATRPFSSAACWSRRSAGRASSRRSRSGLWEAVGYTDSNTAHFKADTGAEKVHRRSLYTFWKRTSPPPQMTTFDAPSREACTVRRERTNTPLQALLLMNEPQFVEASRALAERTLREGGPTTDDRLTYMFRLATARRPTPKSWPS